MKDWVSSPEGIMHNLHVIFAPPAGGQRVTGTPDSG
jgi:hypothetical protein